MSDNKPAMITTLIDDWKQRSAETAERLKLKYLPWNFDEARIDEVEAFLSMSSAEQADKLEVSFNEDAEFLIELLTARALYKDPVDRNPGSITQDKVDRYPERYGRKP